MKIELLIITTIMCIGFAGCDKSNNNEENNLDNQSENTDANNQESVNNSNNQDHKIIFTKDDSDLFEQYMAESLSICAPLCQISKNLGCSMPTDECLENCEEMGDTLVCPEQNIKYMQCAVEKNSQHFECLESMGFAILKDGYCPEEHEELNKCIEEYVKTILDNQNDQ
jgi:hypothetical protein